MDDLQFGQRKTIRVQLLDNSLGLVPTNFCSRVGVTGITYKRDDLSFGGNSRESMTSEQYRSIREEFLMPLPLCFPDDDSRIAIGRRDKMVTLSENQVGCQQISTIFDKVEWWDSWVLSQRNLPTEEIVFGTVVGFNKGEHEEILIEVEFEGCNGIVACHAATLSTGRSQNKGVYIVPYPGAKVVVLMPVSFCSSFEHPVVIGEVRNGEVLAPAAANHDSSPGGSRPFISFEDGFTVARNIERWSLLN